MKRISRVDDLLDAKWVEMVGKTRIVNAKFQDFRRILAECGPGEKRVPCLPPGFPVGKRVRRNDARYRSRAYRAGCALFRLGTNRLLKISGRA